MKIIDNFLEKNDFLDFQKEIFSDKIPWYFKDKQYTDELKSKNDEGYYCCCFYNYGEPDFKDLNNYLFKIYKKLDVKSLIQVRANATHKIKNTKELNFHTDYNYEHSLTAIYYLNTNDGGTVLKINNKQTLVNSVENRMVIFKSTTPHSIKPHTDVNRRIVININYF
jgi:hypothetical protein